MERLRIAAWHNLPSGGGKRQLYNHVRGLIGRGHYVESWCPDTADQKYLPLGEIITENIVPLGAKKGYYFDAFKSFQRVRQLINVLEAHCQVCAEQISKRDFDVLYANACLFLRTTSIGKYVNLPSAIYLNEPYRWFYEALPDLPWVAAGRPALSLRSIKDCLRNRLMLGGMRLQAKVERDYARSFDWILVNSLYSRESILRAYSLEPKVCYLGIDTDFYHPSGERKENYVVGVGTIYYGKGVDRAIRAVATIRKERRPDLVWVGNGASAYDLQQFNRLAQERQVNFFPKLNVSDGEVVSLLSRASAMIYTSRLEPFGMAPLEANACGTAVVAIAEGGVRESIRDGINGFLVHEDDPQMLGECLSKIIESPALALTMGTQAREYVIAHWNMEQCTNNIESMLVNLLRSAKQH